VSLTPEQFQYVFGNTLTAEESAELYERWTIPSPARPLFQAATANLNPHSQTRVDLDNEDRGPLRLTMGGRDRMVPEAITTSTYKHCRRPSAVTQIEEYEDRGHSLTIDHGRREVADCVLTWATDMGLRCEDEATSPWRRRDRAQAGAEQRPSRQDRLSWPSAALVSRPLPPRTDV
jgi:hypothetical protein